jgi:shikimate kinase
MNIILIGYMSSGKSTIGRKLAYRLGMEFIDTDEAFESKYKMAITDFFEIFGENKFRELERIVLTESLQNENTVISTGGGTPCFFDNMNVIKENGITVFLKLHPNSIFDRLIHSKKQRPLLKNLTLEELKLFIIKQLNVREQFYNLSEIIIKSENINTNDLINELKAKNLEIEIKKA